MAPKKVRYTSFMGPKSATSTRKTVHLVACSSLPPAASKTRLMFSSVRFVWPWIVVSPPIPSWPEA